MAGSVYSFGRYTTNSAASKVYAMVTNGWPGETIQLESVEAVQGMTVRILGTEGNLIWEPATLASGISVKLPRLENNRSKWAWTIVISLPAV